MTRPARIFAEVLLWLIDIGLAACGHDYKKEKNKMKSETVQPENLLMDFSNLPQWQRKAIEAYEGEYEVAFVFERDKSFDENWEINITKHRVRLAEVEDFPRCFKEKELP